ncbi:MAG: radical SAM protein, partial [bacterium]
PGLIDLKDIIRKTKKFSDSYWFEFINVRGAGKEFMDVLKRKYPKSYDVLIDKKRFQEFVKESKKIISSENIKIQGIVIH